MKFGTSFFLKPSNDRGEFEVDLATSKNNIAENSFALGHETHNKVLKSASRAHYVVKNYPFQDITCTLKPVPLDAGETMPS